MRVPCGGVPLRALAPSLNLFVGKIIENDIFLYDFNKGNFVFRRTSPDESRMVYFSVPSAREFHSFLRKIVPVTDKFSKNLH